MRSEVGLGRLPQWSFHSLIQLGWLANGLQSSAYLHVPSLHASIMEDSCCARLFHGCWGSEHRASCLYDEHVAD